MELALKNALVTVVQNVRLIVAQLVMTDVKVAAVMDV